MKKMKKMMAVLVVLAMLLSMVCTSAYADIKITGTQAGKTYTIYKLMDLHEDAGTYVYTVNNSNWEEFFTTGAGKDYAILDAAKQVTWTYSTNDDAAAKALAEAAVAAAEAKDITPDGSAVATGDTLTFAGLDDGYYVLKSNTDTILTLNSVYGNSLTLFDKNFLPYVDKAVKNPNVADSYGAAAYAEIGDTVYYKVTLAVDDDAENYVIKDKLPTGVTLNTTPDTTSVEVWTDENCTSPLATSNYTVSANSGNGELSVTFTNTYLATLNPADKIYITYSGTVNSNVTTGIGEGTNQNTAVLEVSEVVADSAVANINTFKIQVNKVDKVTGAALEGAQFKLFNASDKCVAVDANTGAISWVAEDDANAKVFTTPEGTFTIKGLIPGTYELKEIKAPAGYNLLTTPETVLIKTEGLSDGENGDVTVTVENSKGQVLPGTGGMGTTLFYVFGGILMAGAAVLLVSKKRRAN